MILLYCICKPLSGPSGALLPKAPTCVFQLSFIFQALGRCSRCHGGALAVLSGRYLGGFRRASPELALTTTVTFPVVPPVTAWVRMLQRHHSFLSSRFSCKEGSLHFMGEELRLATLMAKQLILGLQVEKTFFPLVLFYYIF